MIKQRYRVFKWRRYLKKNRDGNNRCRNCGRSKKHARWCWGPRGLHNVWLVIKNHKIRYIGFAWHAYKSELEWVGTEPWHRY